MKTEKSRIPHLTPQKAAALKSRQRKIEQRITDLIDKSDAISEALCDAGYLGRYVWDGVAGFKLIDLMNEEGEWSPVADGSLKRPGRVRDFYRKVSDAFGTAPSAVYRSRVGDLAAAFSRTAPLLPFYVDEKLEPVRGVEGIYNGPVEGGE
jgi:hypothetical protein